MKNSLLLLAGFAALSLASCSQTSTTDTTATGTPATDSGTMATASTTSDDMYHTRGNRMADRFVGDMKITDEAMKEKLRTAYYNRSKRYGMMREKYASDTAGMGAAMRQYNTDTDAEFQSVITDPTQYQSYQSSRSTYDEANNMDMTDQGAASGSMSSDNGSASGNMSNDASGNMSSGSASGDMNASGSDMSGSGVEKSKSKMSDGSKVKVKTDGSVKMKDGDGNKAKM